MSTEATLESSSAPAEIAPTATAGARHHPGAAKAASRPRALWKPVLLGLAAAVILGWLAHTLIHGYRYEETDDAYVVGHVHQISPRVAGQVQEVLVDDNQDVKAGEPLVRIDPQEFEIAVAKARAALAQARAQEVESRASLAQIDAEFGEAEARVQQARAQLAQSDAQLELARLTLARNEQLFQKGGVITQADLDNARSAFRAAEAAQAANRANLVAAQSGVGSAQAAQKSARAQITAAEANVAVAETALRDAERTLGYTTILAPTAGRVGNKAVETGNHVVSGQALLSLAAPAPWIIANFKETQLARMHAGQDVELTIDALPNADLRGRIDSIAPASGAQFALLPPDNATGNFNKVVQRVPVKIALDPASLRELGTRLRLGLSAVVDVRVR